MFTFENGHHVCLVSSCFLGRQSDLHCAKDDALNSVNHKLAVNQHLTGQILHIPRL